MWRNTTIDAKISILLNKMPELESNLIECLQSKKTKKFITDSADYLVMFCLWNCKNNHFFNLDREDASINCGRIKGLTLKQFCRIKGLLVGLGVLERNILKTARELGIAGSIDPNMYSKAIKKAWSILHDNDEYTSSIGFEESSRISATLQNIAFWLTDEMLSDPKFDDVVLLLEIISDEDILTLFLGMMSLNEKSKFSFRRDDSRKTNLYLLSNIHFGFTDLRNLKELYSDVLKDICSVITTFKLSEYSVVFIPNDKYFFGGFNDHRDSCFSTINVINKLMHRAVANLSKFEDEREGK